MLLFNPFCSPLGAPGANTPTTQQVHPPPETQEDFSISPTHALEVQAPAVRPKAPPRALLDAAASYGQGFFGRAVCRPYGWDSEEAKTYQQSWNAPLGNTLIFMVKPQTLLQHPYSAGTTLTLSYSCRAAGIKKIKRPHSKVMAQPHQA